MTKRQLHVESVNGVPVEDLEVEVVERKGAGHPDSLIDGAAEAVSRGLCQYYLKEYGTILHHNVDKGLLVGGRSTPRFGGGEVIEPIYVVVAGRATTHVIRDGRVESVPVGGIALSSMKKFLKSTVRHLNVEEHLVIDYRIKQGSEDLISVFDRSTTMPLSNDTSIGVGYAPFSPTERLVLETERMLNSEGVKKELPEIGEDIKVMGIREGKEVNLTVAAATVSEFIPDKSHYQSVIEEARSRVLDLAAKTTTHSIKLFVNAGDDYKRGAYYLTVTGTSAEAGDDGNTGRGNRGNGLICPMRQFSMEATAGKNPVNHTGKLFNVLAQVTAEKIYSEVKGLREVYVRLISKIGNPIDTPKLASSSVMLEPGANFSTIRSEIESIIDQELSKIRDLTPLIMSGNVTMF